MILGPVVTQPLGTNVYSKYGQQDNMQPTREQPGIMKQG